MYTGQLASFKAGKDIAVYAAVDTRVIAKLEWLKNWKDTGSAIVTSNDVKLELFRTTAKTGETVMLGTNGGENESANYIVFAVHLENDKAPAGDIKWGDANCDNTVSVADAVAILQYLGNKDKYKLTENGKSNAEVYNNGDGTFNNAAGSYMTANAKNFWKELAKDVVPAVESNVIGRLVPDIEKPLFPHSDFSLYMQIKSPKIFLQYFVICVIINKKRGGKYR